MPAKQFIIQPRQAGRTLGDVLRGQLRKPWLEVRSLIELGLVQLNGKPCAQAGRRLKAGQRVEIRAQRSPHHAPSQKPLRPSHASLDAPVLRHVDDHIIVVDKPAGLTTMRHASDVAEFGNRARRFLPATLADLLPKLLAAQHKGKPGKVRAVHRLDKETSGLVVFARTPAAESHLGKQFRAHITERRYLALVRGQAQSERIESCLVDDRGDGRRGSSTAPGVGKRAVTHVQVVESLGEYTLVECRLETGRTHQVRIHLAEAGAPLCGETIYDRPLHGRPLPDLSGAKRIALHAASLGFIHPATGQKRVWTSPLPKDMALMVKRFKESR